MSNTDKTSSIISRLQDVFWPIERKELKLFLPMATMMLCMLFNFGALRSIKDSLVVPNIGAEVISFLKLWLVLPATILFTITYVKLSNSFSYQQLFYLIISFFLVFFALFTYLLYPYQEYFHPSSQTSQALIAAWPHGKWFILIVDKWSYALMYIFCELWSAVVINLLFWQFANYIFNTKVAKRFYPTFGMIGNLGLVMAGNLLVTLSDGAKLSCNNMVESYEQTSQVLGLAMIVIIGSGLLAMVIYWYINRYVLPQQDASQVSGRGSNTKTKLSVRDSIKLLLNSKYIGHIVILILCYGFDLIGYRKSG